MMLDKISMKDTGGTIQRIPAVADCYVEDLSTIFNRELCSIPSSLFENDGLPRVPQRSMLANTNWKLGDCSKTKEAPEPTDDPKVMFVGRLFSSAKYPLV
ncbi:hypothetical protein DPMN_038926 [Dreissena polymorpha]|uniref:Uncharacterized protein n=1 Tax=Dreissena polymorpha TaxID=45954 RepID=A0A9D4RQU3_DREPO|nr:hypothetical protein DPMN_038926 [Dreissena polymorpha]